LLFNNTWPVYPARDEQVVVAGIFLHGGLKGEVYTSV
jgi:hypothetical protein